MIMKRKIFLSLLLILFSIQLCHASLLDTLKDTIDATGTSSGSSKSGSDKVDLGLKEALNVGVKNSIKFLGKNDGYFGNQAVKILLPEKIQKTETVLRS